MIAPIANISIGGPYFDDLKITSGALYHLVETYSVKGGLYLVSFASPKSANFTVLLYSSIFSGLRSLWK